MNFFTKSLDKWIEFLACVFISIPLADLLRIKGVSDIYRFLFVIGATFFLNRILEAAIVIAYGD